MFVLVFLDFVSLWYLFSYNGVVTFVLFYKISQKGMRRVM